MKLLSLRRTLPSLLVALALGCGSPPCQDANECPGEGGDPGGRDDAGASSDGGSTTTNDGGGSLDGGSSNDGGGSPMRDSPTTGRVIVCAASVEHACIRGAKSATRTAYPSIAE